ncbi:MAG: hypothetical protein GY870_04290 [archaeon]|nr:hypothetical protein [archaeon]
MSKRKLKKQIIHEKIKQPVNHNEPDGTTYEQRIDYLIPEDANIEDSPVFFYLGHEMSMSDSGLLKLYNAYGKRNDIIYFQSEHRGYGISLTDDEDQSVPSYIRIDQALTDNHRVVEYYKKKFKGPWIVAGYSYGGGLVIDFAAKYPNDINLVLSSSGVVDWPFTFTSYDIQMRKNLGEKLYQRGVKHINNLKSEEILDKNWRYREIIIGIFGGMTQMESLQKIKPLIGFFLRLPTRLLILLIETFNSIFLLGKGSKLVKKIYGSTFSREDALKKSSLMRTWTYQQFMETGVFSISSEPNGLENRSKDELVEMCNKMFGQDPPALKNPEWSPRNMIKDIDVPLIYITGGNDPWSGLCLESDYQIKNGKYFFYPDSWHCPDRSDPKKGIKVMEEVLRNLKK